MKPNKYFFKLLDILTVLCLLVFFASFGFKDSKSSGWYQQWFPNMNGSTITSLTFLDSLTGYAVTSINSDTLAYILRTTNGGDNWNINYTYKPPYTNWDFMKIVFLNSNMGFAFGWTEIFKTTDGGNSWSIMYNDVYPQDVAVINQDTILAVTSDGFAGGVYRSTNSGLNWQALGPTGGTGQPSKIYMYNKDMGFCLGNQMRKTTNGGVNWFVIPGESYQDIKFFNTLTGWKTDGNMKISTNGGLNWTQQQIPNVNELNLSMKISINNRDTIWFVGGYKNINSFYYGIIFKTTNGGGNWGYQLPDTSFHIGGYYDVKFVNNLSGWAFSPEIVQTEVHTIVGGDSTIYLGIGNNISSIPKDYVLYQNYPNPFNPSTNIKYQITNSKFITLKVYDLLGKEVITLVNKRQSSGTYVVGFNASNLTNGIYFYTLFADGVRVDTKKAVLIK